VERDQYAILVGSGDRANNLVLIGSLEVAEAVLGAGSPTWSSRRDGRAPEWEVAIQDGLAHGGNRRIDVTVPEAIDFLRQLQFGTEAESMNQEA